MQLEMLQQTLPSGDSGMTSWLVQNWTNERKTLRSGVRMLEEVPARQACSTSRDIPAQSGSMRSIYGTSSGI